MSLGVYEREVSIRLQLKIETRKNYIRDLVQFRIKGCITVPTHTHHDNNYYSTVVYSGKGAGQSASVG